MMNCPPPMPGMNITISIDLGAMMGNPGICDEPEPPCDDEKLTFFNENNRPKGGFGGAKDSMCEKLGKHGEQKTPESEEDCGPGDSEVGEDKKKKFFNH